MRGLKRQGMGAEKICRAQKKKKNSVCIYIKSSEGKKKPNNVIQQLHKSSNYHEEM